MRLFNLISTVSSCFYRLFGIHWFLSGKNWNQVVWYSLHQDVAHASNIFSAIVWMFWKFFFWEIWGALRNDDYVLRGEREHGWVQSGDPGNQYCMTKHGPSYPQIVYCLRVSGVWNYRMDERIKWSRLPRNTEASRFLSARQIAPRTKHFQKIFPTKHNAMPMTRGKDKRLTWP